LKGAVGFMQRSKGADIAARLETMIAKRQGGIFKVAGECVLVALTGAAHAVRRQLDVLHYCLRYLARLQNEVSVGDRLADVGQVHSLQQHGVDEPDGATHAVGIDPDERAAGGGGELDEVVGI
jgi:hypothetical protein